MFLFRLKCFWGLFFDLILFYWSHHLDFGTYFIGRMRVWHFCHACLYAERKSTAFDFISNLSAVALSEVGTVISWRILRALLKSIFFISFPPFVVRPVLRFPKLYIRSSGRLQSQGGLFQMGRKNSFYNIHIHDESRGRGDGRGGGWGEVAEPRIR